MSMLSELEELHLDHSEITDEGLKELASLPKIKLRILDLKGTKIAQQGAEILQQQLPDCDVSTSMF